MTLDRYLALKKKLMRKSHQIQTSLERQHQNGRISYDQMVSLQNRAQTKINAELGKLDDEFARTRKS